MLLLLVMMMMLFAAACCCEKRSLATTVRIYVRKIDDEIEVPIPECQRPCLRRCQDPVAQTEIGMSRKSSYPDLELLPPWVICSMMIPQRT